MGINDIIIRAEKETDRETIHNLVAESFSSATHTDGDEHNLVDRIRITDEYIPELPLVAVYADKITGHIMMSQLSWWDKPIEEIEVSYNAGYRELRMPWRNVELH